MASRPTILSAYFKRPSPCRSNGFDSSPMPTLAAEGESIAARLHTIAIPNLGRWKTLQGRVGTQSGVRLAHPQTSALDRCLPARRGHRRGHRRHLPLCRVTWRARLDGRPRGIDLPQALGPDGRCSRRRHLLASSCADACIRGCRPRADPPGNHRLTRPRRMTTAPIRHRNS